MEVDVCYTKTPNVSGKENLVFPIIQSMGSHKLPCVRGEWSTLTRVVLHLATERKASTVKYGIHSIEWNSCHLRSCTIIQGSRPRNKKNVGCPLIPGQ